MKILYLINYFFYKEIYMQICKYLLINQLFKELLKIKAFV